MDRRRFDLTPAELQAIEDHKYYLSLERGQEVSIEEAIEDFLARFVAHWRGEKARQDIRDQLTAMQQYHERRTQEVGVALEPDAAAEEWCEQHAAMWRAERESLERNGFLREHVVVHSAEGLHLRPWSAVAATAARFDCDLYVHRPGMPYWNFLLEGRPFMNVKSVVGLLSLGVELGDPLEFIATGAESAPALAAVRALVEGAD